MHYPRFITNKHLKRIFEGGRGGRVNDLSSQRVDPRYKNEILFVGPTERETKSIGISYNVCGNFTLLGKFAIKIY